MKVEIEGWIESPDDLPVAVLNPLKLDVLSECFIQMQEKQNQIMEDTTPVKLAQDPLSDEEPHACANLMT